MGSTDEPNIKGIDASVGGLVWVRRRNGSWWPGRIMGLDELSESCLVSPRSGTPIKLLGREDASVDWYNLEKSKRVKAFRCGEYDACINKAKASAANSSKKAVKYARREDAILHALEIESARLGKDHPDYFSRKDNSGGDQGGSAQEPPTISHSGKENEDMTDEMSESEDYLDLAPELSQSGISFEEPNHINGSKGHSMLVKRRKTPNDSEDDGTEGIKRMRGLEDLGMGVGSKRKAQAAGVLELVQQDNASFYGPNTGNCLSNGGPINGSRNHSSSLKRKRSQVANVHEFLKRKNRRRPLTKVLESTAMVSVPVACDELPSSSGSPLRGLSDSKVSGMDSNESRRSVSAVVNNNNNNNNNNSDSTGVSCENGVSLNASEHAADASQTNNKTKDNEISSIPGLAKNESSDRLFDVPFVGGDKPSADFSPIFVSCSSEMPEVGDLGRQAEIEGHNESGCTRSVAVHKNIISQRIEKGIEHLDGFSQGSDQKVDCNGVGGSLAPYTCTLQSKSKSVVEELLDGFRDWKPMSREPRVRGPIMEEKILPDGSLTRQRLLPYRQSRYTVHSRYQMTDFPGKPFSADSSLYDVKIEVKANYRPQHVPLVSLMSKLNGKAIIGHPLTVEVLSDDYCGNLTQEAGMKCNEIVHLMKRNSGGRVPTKHVKLQSRKSAKAKKSGLLSKKIRKLSSLTGRKQGVADRKPVADKPEAPVIACIPLKLVFSRINEALNGSARPTHRPLTSGNS
ncbi:uncharacterized protein At1g51745-like isoform X2 [Durio zibethinus]|uniref:Uncharacterized protein At1g51745-like isoform X2 n=1 Tax=Durio zibethinus TaxID=66656 RepID=A0A6P5X003_DURZI|nr:uncharacterized protein At1g51745-like isoform X2 [Durio zibethinus]